MPFSSGNSSESTQIHNSGSEECLIEQRKRKRMQSNRESARRSRMRKQKHLDDLIAQANRIRNEKEQLSMTIDVTNQRFAQIEAENLVLRAQVSELGNRLDSLNEILKSINNNNNNSNSNCTTSQCTGGTSGWFEFDYYNLENTNNNPWNMNMMNVNQQPIMASAADMFGY